MGKKKSVALMVFITIIVVVLCALVLFPSVPVGVKDWKPVASQYDFSTELNGGYYTYYYPEGVIPATEYEDTVKGWQEIVDSADSTEKEKQDAKDELEKYQGSYTQHKGLYLSTEDEYGIFANGEVSDEFASTFQKSADEIAKRYEAKAYSDYRVAIVDDYAIRVELPKVETNYASVFSMFATMGKISITLGEDTVDEMKEDGAKASDFIESFTAAKSNKIGAAFVKVKFTEKGEEMIARVKDQLTDSTEKTTALHIKVGEEDIIQIYSDSLMSNNREARVLAVDKANKEVVKL